MTDAVPPRLTDTASARRRLAPSRRAAAAMRPSAGSVSTALPPSRWRLACSAILLVTHRVGKGYTAFTQTEIALEINFDPR